MSQFALIAFDLDGTLVDSDALGVPDMVAFLQQEYRLPITLDHWLAPENGYLGLGGPSLLARLQQDFGLQEDFPAFLAKREARLPAMFAQGLPVNPGVAEALATLQQQGRTLCVASNSSLNRIQLSFEHAVPPIGHFFDCHFFSAVAAGSRAKPAPDVYLTAARHWAAEPSTCLAVEDSPGGVQAAVSAGFTCVAYTGLAELQAPAVAALFAAGATATFSHWHDFLPLLAQLEA